MLVVSMDEYKAQASCSLSPGTERRGNTSRCHLQHVKEAGGIVDGLACSAARIPHDDVLLGS